MGIFNNVGRFTNINIKDYIKNFNEQIEIEIGCQQPL